ncbi:hypothetical protein DPMN_010719 [Dreissena polymorpha]|uniref:Uncharacterized protein n=1 Tax=Dreissena polymorpha TaxID=45954 RepID=A0A9D4N2R7_DREPO|nr:hypothetical protein DPMN_010719 [Dreissena polymorpha]
MKAVVEVPSPALVDSAESKSKGCGGGALPALDDIAESKSKGCGGLAFTCLG